jgi:lincosamide nucleotidyltransferase A/C/D/E
VAVSTALTAVSEGVDGHHGGRSARGCGDARGARRRSSDCRRLGNRRLVGTQSREHRDLDLALRADALDASLNALTSKGYRVTTDSLPVRIELSAAISHVDLHPLHYELDGSAWQAAPDDARFIYPAEGWAVGRIGGRDVICLSAQQQRIFHTGYELSDVARHDMALLDRHQRCC